MHSTRADGTVATIAASIRGAILGAPLEDLTRRRVPEAVVERRRLGELMMQACLSLAADAPGRPPAEAALEVLNGLAESRPIDGAVKGEIAVFAEALSHLGVSGDPEKMKLLAAIAVREQRRSMIVEQQFEEVTAAAAGLGISLTPLRGPSLARAVYPKPWLRHSHALCFLVEAPAARAALARHLQPHGWQEVPADAFSSHQTILGGHGRNRVAVELQDRPFPWTGLVLPPPQDGALTNEAALAEILGRTVYNVRAPSLRWMTDVMFLSRAKDADPVSLAELIVAAGFAAAARLRLEALLSLAPHSAERPRALLQSTLDLLAANRRATDDAPEVRQLLELRRLLHAGRVDRLLGLALSPTLISDFLATRRAWQVRQRNRRALVGQPPQPGIG